MEDRLFVPSPDERYPARVPYVSDGLSSMGLITVSTLNLDTNLEADWRDRVPGALYTLLSIGGTFGTSGLLAMLFAGVEGIESVALAGNNFNLLPPISGRDEDRRL